MTCVAVIALVILACLALTGCGQKEKEKTTKQEVNHEESEVETSATDTATTATQKTETTQPKTDKTDVVIKVAIDAARANNPDLPELRVVEAKIIDEVWARVVLEPVDRSTDAATWFMKKESGKWTVFDFGTAVMPENHPDAPKELFE